MTDNSREQKFLFRYKTDLFYLQDICELATVPL